MTYSIVGWLGGPYSVLIDGRRIAECLTEAAAHAVLRLYVRPLWG